MQVVDMERGEFVDDGHDIRFDYSPTSLEKGPLYPSGPGALSLAVPTMAVFTSSFVKGASKS
jgi:hypothetical protein